MAAELTVAAAISVLLVPAPPGVSMRPATTPPQETPMQTTALLAVMLLIAAAVTTMFADYFGEDDTGVKTAAILLGAAIVVGSVALAYTPFYRVLAHTLGLVLT